MVVASIIIVYWFLDITILRQEVLEVPELPPEHGTPFMSTVELLLAKVLSTFSFFHLVGRINDKGADNEKHNIRDGIENVNKPLRHGHGI